MISRRQAIIALGVGSLSSPFVGFAQPLNKIWRIGYLSQRHLPNLPASDATMSAFIRGMGALGYIEGKNLNIEWRSAEDRIESLPGLAADLVRLNVDVIVTAGTPAVRAAQKATTTIPIVMGNAGDPVGAGFVKSLARPGGNITGLSNIAAELGPKLLEMLLGMVPKVSRVAMLVHPDNSTNATTLKYVQVGAQHIGAKIFPMEARNPKEIENAFSRMTRERAGAVIVPGDTFFNTYRREIAELAIVNRLPSISGYWAYAEAGGLMSYAQNMTVQQHRITTFVDKIFKGAKPGDLPVELPTKFDLVINFKTAKALGLSIPQSLLISADKVIE